MPKVTINTDGSCHGNPGPGGFAAVVTRETGLENPATTTFTVVGGDPKTTNNRMELSAVIEALRYLNADMPGLPCEITVRSDSKYVVDAFNQGWVQNWLRKGWTTAKGKPVANVDLWIQLTGWVSDHRITWEWIEGHAGDPMNEHCDRLANQQADNSTQKHQYWAALFGSQEAWEREDQETGDLPFVPNAEEENSDTDPPFGLEEEPQGMTDQDQLAMAILSHIFSAARRSKTPEDFLQKVKDVAESLEDEGLL